MHHCIHITWSCFPFSVLWVCLTCSLLFYPQARFCTFPTLLNGLIGLPDSASGCNSLCVPLQKAQPLSCQRECWWLSVSPLSYRDNSTVDVVTTSGKWAARGENKVQQRLIELHRDLILLWEGSSLMYINALLSTMMQFRLVSSNTSSVCRFVFVLLVFWGHTCVVTVINNKRVLIR